MIFALMKDPPTPRSRSGRPMRAISDTRSCWSPSNKKLDRGREGFWPPLPPNRTCGSPAYGSPVVGFLIGGGLVVRGLCRRGTVLFFRSRRWAIVGDRLCIVRSRAACPACAERRAAVAERNDRGFGTESAWRV